MKKVITIIVEGLPSDIKKKESELIELMAGEMISYKSDVITEPKKDINVPSFMSTNGKTIVVHRIGVSEV